MKLVRDFDNGGSLVERWSSLAYATDTELRRRAAELVCNMSRSIDEARALLEMLGLVDNDGKFVEDGPTSTAPRMLPTQVKARA